MKNLLIVLASFTLGTSLSFGQGYTVNHESPTSVVNAIFHAASNSDYTVLGTLCDPLGEGDKDTKYICQLAFGFNGDQLRQLEESGKTPEQLFKEFNSVFGEGKITGSTRFKTSDFGNYAEVDFLFYPEGKEVKETMKLVQRGNNWYLSSF